MALSTADSVCKGRLEADAALITNAGCWSLAAGICISSLMSTQRFYPRLVQRAQTDERVNISSLRVSLPIIPGFLCRYVVHIHLLYDSFIPHYSEKKAPKG